MNALQAASCAANELSLGCVCGGQQSHQKLAAEEHISRKERREVVQRGENEFSAGIHRDILLSLAALAVECGVNEGSLPRDI